MTDTQIKEYKKLLTIELKDWTILQSEKTLQELVAYMESCTAICLIDGVAFNKFEFKKAYEKNLDEISQFIFWLSKTVQEALRIREKEKKQRIWRWFESVQEILNYLNDKKLM